jgi:hypothetical protein
MYLVDYKEFICGITVCQRNRKNKGFFSLWFLNIRQFLSEHQTIFLFFCRLFFVFRYFSKYNFYISFFDYFLCAQLLQFAENQLFTNLCCYNLSKSCYNLSAKNGSVITICQNAVTICLCCYNLSKLLTIFILNHCKILSVLLQFVKVMNNFHFKPL